MTFTEQIRALFASMRQDLRDLPQRMDRWTLRQHAPEDIDGEAVCLRCRASWPCDEWVKVDQRLTTSR